MVIVACAVFTLVAHPIAVRASGPILTLTGKSSGSIGSTVTYAYNWDASDCSAAGVIAGDTVILVWENASSSEPVGSTLVAIAGAGGSCTGTVSGRVPGDSTTGDNHVSTAYVCGKRTGRIVIRLSHRLRCKRRADRGQQGQSDNS